MANLPKIALGAWAWGSDGTFGNNFTAESLKLICVGGRGYYQEWGKAPVEMTPGTVINIPANVKHWHGAAPDSWFSHLTVEIAGEEIGTEWLEAVFDEDYSKLK